MDKIIIKKSWIQQFPNKLGVYANIDFKKGDIVIVYQLKLLSLEEFKKLVVSEKKFVHTHKGKIYLYSIPERYVNHSSHPNTYQDLERKCDVALCDIKKGEEITTNASQDDI